MENKFLVEATKEMVNQILFYNNKKYQRNLSFKNSNFHQYEELDSDFNNEEIPEVLRDIISWYEPDIQLIISFFNNN